MKALSLLVRKLWPRLKFCSRIQRGRRHGRRRGRGHQGYDISSPDIRPGSLKNTHKEYNQQNATHPCAYGVAVRGFEDIILGIYAKFFCEWKEHTCTCENFKLKLKHWYTALQNTKSYFLQDHIFESSEYIHITLFWDEFVFLSILLLARNSCVRPCGLMRNIMNKKVFHRL